MVLLFALVLFLLLPLLAAGTSWPIVMLSCVWAGYVYVAWRGRAGAGSFARLASARGSASLEIIAGFVTAPGAVQTNLTMAPGDSLTVRATPTPLTPVRLVAAWTSQKVAGILRVRSPKMHDNVQGLRIKSVVGDPQPLWRLGLPQRLYQTDTLTVDLSGSAVGGAIETAVLLLQYDDLTGASGSYIDTPTLMKRGVNLVGIEKSIAVTAGGGWTGSAALNATFDPWKANTQYALVGYECDVQCAAIRWKGVDTGNLGVGGPGNQTFKELTGNWFMRISDEYGTPCIPVFNSNNRGGITIDAAQDDGAAAIVVNSLFVELAPQ